MLTRSKHSKRQSKTTTRGYLSSALSARPTSLLSYRPKCLTVTPGRWIPPGCLWSQVASTTWLSSVGIPPLFKQTSWLLSNPSLTWRLARSTRVPTHPCSNNGSQTKCHLVTTDASPKNPDVTSLKLSENKLKLFLSKPLATIYMKNKLKHKNTFWNTRSSISCRIAWNL